MDAIFVTLESPTTLLASCDGLWPARKPEKAQRSNLSQRDKPPIMGTQAQISDTANRQNAILDRAFVTSNEVSIEEERRDGVLIGWIFRPVIVNSGNIPAKDLTYYSTGTSGPAKGSAILNPSYPINESPSTLDPEQGHYNNVDNPFLPTHLPHLVLGPHASAKIGSVELSADDTRARIAEKWRGYISGMIRYCDQINPGVEHVTKFCYMIWASQMVNETTAPPFELCDYWNCIDDECKEDKKQCRDAVTRAFKGAGKKVPEDFYGQPMSFLIEPTPEAAAARSQELARAADTHLYLVEPSSSAAEKRNAELWHAIECRPQPQCDPQQATKYLLATKPLTDGRMALVMPRGMADGIVASNLNGSATLTVEEQSALLAATKIGPVLIETTPPSVATLPDGRGAVALPTGQANGLTPSEIASLKKDTEMGDQLPPHYRYRVQ